MLVKHQEDVNGMVLNQNTEHVHIQSLSQGTIPDDWRKVLVIPIYKKGDRSNPVNYRPISLICIACKILEHIVLTSSYLQSFR